MPDPINMVTSLLLRLRSQLPCEGIAAGPSPSMETMSASPPPPLQMGGSEQSYRLTPSDVGWKSPVLMLPKWGLLKVGFSLPGERVRFFHPVHAQSGTESIPLPSSAAVQGELWLVRLPEQQFLLLWMPLGIPPQPLNQLWLGLYASEPGSRPPHSHLHNLWTRRCLTLGIILCLMFTLI